MRIRIAGIGLIVGPDHELTLEECALLDRVDQCREGEEPEAACALCLEPDINLGTCSARPAPAQILWDGSRINIQHPRFGASVRLDSRSAVLRRSPGDLFPLRITLRVLLAAVLPSQGALPLHGAGVILREGGVVCFGPSGAGKTTIATAATTPVVSDELTVAWISQGPVKITSRREGREIVPKSGRIRKRIRWDVDVDVNPPGGEGGVRGGGGGSVQGGRPDKLQAAGVSVGTSRLAASGSVADGTKSRSAVAIGPFHRASSPSMSATGLLEDDVVLPAAPLSALIALDRGPDFALQPLAWREAFHSLLGVVVVPPVPALWSQVLSLVSELAQAVPSYRLAWSPEVPVWRHIADALNLGPAHTSEYSNQLDNLHEQAWSCT